MLHVLFLSPHSDPEAFPGEPDSGGQCVYEYQLAQALSAIDLQNLLLITVVELSELSVDLKTLFRKKRSSSICLNLLRR